MPAWTLGKAWDIDAPEPDARGLERFVSMEDPDAPLRFSRECAPRHA